VVKLDRGHFPILPPTPLLIKINIKGEGRLYPGLDGLLHLFRKTFLQIETNLPAPIRPPHSDLFDGGLLTEGGKGKNPDQKKDNPSDQTLISSLVLQIGFDHHIV
jgi:hypothetical protein